jgi:hypothetical protein
MLYDVQMRMYDCVYPNPGVLAMTPGTHSVWFDELITQVKWRI